VAPVRSTRSREDPVESSSKRGSATIAARSLVAPSREFSGCSGGGDPLRLCRVAEPGELEVRSELWQWLKEPRYGSVDDEAALEESFAGSAS
jgi:hypothetical protein